MFPLQVPTTGEAIKLHTIAAWDAAVHCAAISAAQRERNRLASLAIGAGAGAGGAGNNYDGNPTTPHDAREAPLSLNGGVMSPRAARMMPLTTAGQETPLPPPRRAATPYHRPGSGSVRPVSPREAACMPEQRRTASGASSGRAGSSSSGRSVFSRAMGFFRS